jgi:hypothetical protein
VRLAGVLPRVDFLTFTIRHHLLFIAYLTYVSQMPYPAPQLTKSRLAMQRLRRKVSRR